MMILALLLAAGAQTPAKPAARPAAKTAAGASRTQMHFDVSPAGQAVMKKYLGVPDPAFVALAKQLQEVAVQVKGLGAAPKLDMGRLEQLLRQQEQLQAQMRKRSDDRLLAMLGEMSEADRLGFARGTVTVVPQGKAPPSR